MYKLQTYFLSTGGDMKKLHGSVKQDDTSIRNRILHCRWIYQP